MVSGTCTALWLTTCQDHRAFSSWLSHGTTLLVRQEQLRMYPIDYSWPIHPALKRSTLPAGPSLVGTTPGLLSQKGWRCWGVRRGSCSRGRQEKDRSVCESGSTESWLGFSASVSWFPRGLGQLLSERMEDEAGSAWGRGSYDDALGSWNKL